MEAGLSSWIADELEAGTHPRAVLYEYQNKGLANWAVRKSMKTKGSTNGCQGVLLRLSSSNREAWGRAPERLGIGTARPYNGTDSAPYRGLARRTWLAIFPYRTLAIPEVAW
jgi:hypothetical protein